MTGKSVQATGIKETGSRMTGFTVGAFFSFITEFRVGMTGGETGTGQAARE
jgi:hypothetical protein